jgi:hypothetical protein
MLPSKTAPKTQRARSAQPLKKLRKATVEEVEDEGTGSLRNVSAWSTAHTDSGAERGMSNPETTTNTEKKV